MSTGKVTFASSVPAGSIPGMQNFSSRGLTKKQKDQVKTIARSRSAKQEHSVFLTADPMSNGPQIVDLCQIAKGDDDDQRSSNKINPTALDIKYTISKGDGENTCRVMVIQWSPMNNDDGPDATGELFQVAGPAPLYPYVFNQGQRSKYKVLYDRIHTLDAGESLQHATIRVYNTRKTTRMSKLHYEDGATAAEGARGKIFLVHFSDSLVSPHPALNLNGSLKYYSV